jgi:hypothetical protein
MTGIPMTDTASPTEPCVVHVTDYDTDCEMCATELAALEGVITAMARGNQEVVTRIAHMGTLPGTEEFLALRVNTLIAWLFGGNRKMRLRFEVGYLMNVASTLAASEQKAARAQLLHGIRHRAQ